MYTICTKIYTHYTYVNLCQKCVLYVPMMSTSKRAVLSIIPKRIALIIVNNRLLSLFF